jgi:hypothetical protein
MFRSVSAKINNVSSDINAFGESIIGSSTELSSLSTKQYKSFKNQGIIIRQKIDQLIEVLFVDINTFSNYTRWTLLLSQLLKLDMGTLYSDDSSAGQIYRELQLEIIRRNQVVVGKFPANKNTDSSAYPSNDFQDNYCKCKFTSDDYEMPTGITSNVIASIISDPEPVSNIFQGIESNLEFMRKIDSDKRFDLELLCNIYSPFIDICLELIAARVRRSNRKEKTYAIESSRFWIHPHEYEESCGLDLCKKPEKVDEVL